MTSVLTEFLSNIETMTKIERNNEGLEIPDRPKEDAIKALRTQEREKILAKHYRLHRVTERSTLHHPL